MKNRSSWRKSIHSQEEHRVPETPSPVYVTLPQQVQRRSEVRDGVAMAVIDKLSGLLENMNHKDNLDELPKNYRKGTIPTGPCASEINNFLNCANEMTQRSQCKIYANALRDCKRRYAKYGGGRSYYGHTHRAPARSPPVYVTPPAQRRSVFRDAAAVAGGVTVGTTMGHVAGSALTGLFGGGGRRQDRYYDEMPRDYQPGSQPTGPCAYEMGQFLNCASVTENLQECAPFSQALRECKRRNGIP